VTEDEERALWAKLARIDRRIGVMGAAVLIIYSIGFGALAYTIVVSEFGFERHVAAATGLVIFFIASSYLLRDFYK
jgi:uncharacterized membrane protein YfcA